MRTTHSSSHRGGRGAGQFPLNFLLGCGPAPDPSQLPPWVWAWTRCRKVPSDATWYEDCTKVDLHTGLKWRNHKGFKLHTPTLNIASVCSGELSTILTFVMTEQSIERNWYLRTLPNWQTCRIGRLLSTWMSLCVFYILTFLCIFGIFPKKSIQSFNLCLKRYTVHAQAFPL